MSEEGSENGEEFEGEEEVEVNGEEVEVNGAEENEENEVGDEAEVSIALSVFRGSGFGQLYQKSYV